jgi:predicted amidophosphoribosyltransferase
VCLCRCIRTWLQRSQTACPICRKPFDATDRPSAPPSCTAQREQQAQVRPHGRYSFPLTHPVTFFLSDILAAHSKGMTVSRC